MLIAYFRKNDGAIVGVAALLLVIGTLVQALSGTHPDISYAPFIDSWFAWDGYESLGWLNAILSALFAFVVFILLNRTVQTLGLMTKLSNMPLLAMAILYFVLPAPLNTPLYWICIYLLILFIVQCIHVLSNEDISVAVINASFLTGLMSIIYPFFVVLLFPLFASIIMSGSVNLRNFLLAIFGIGLPFYFLGAILYLLFPHSLDTIFRLFRFHVPAFIMPVALTGVSLYALASIATFANHSKTLASTTLRDRRKWQFEVVLFVSSALAFPFGGVACVAALALVPAGVIISRSFTGYPGRWVPGVFFLLLSALALINLFYQPSL